MRFIRNKSQCTTCPLRDRTRVTGIGPAAPKIAIFGEAPGADEDYEGLPFVGQAGKYLSWGLAQAGILRYNTWISNCFSCRPPNNSFSGFEGIEAQKACRAGFDQEIAFLKKAGVKVIIVLGNNAKEFFGLPAGTISKVRGSVYDWNGFTVISTFHPSYLSRMRYSKQGAKADLRYIWIGDLKKAKEISLTGWNPPSEDFELYPTIQKLDSFLEEARLRNEALAVDIETTGLNPFYARLVCIGLGRNKSSGICIPFLKKGGDAYWSQTAEKQVKARLNLAFKEFPLIFQHSLFDVNFLRRQKGIKISYDQVQHDTLVLHHAISPELPHTLGFIVSTYGSTPYWKEDFLKRESSILDMDDQTVRRYNLRDCVVLHQILPEMLKDLSETTSKETYLTESLKLLKPIGKAKENGFKINSQKLTRIKKTYLGVQQTLDGVLRSSGKLPESFNLNSDDDLRWFLFGQAPTKFSQLATLKEYAEETKTGKKIRSKKTAIYQRLLGLKALHENTKPIYRIIGYRGRSTGKGSKTSVNERGRLGLRIALQNRLALLDRFTRQLPAHVAEAKNISDLLEWLTVFDDYQEVTTLLERYVSFATGPDGRVHTNLVLHGPPTGRLASSDPNLQNLPAQGIGKQIRKAFIAEEGHKLIGADFSNLEVRVLSYESNDLTLIKQLENGINVHDENTKLLFDIDEKHSLWSEGRQGAKTFQFGKLSYGGGDREVYEQIVLDAPKLNLTFVKYKQAIDRYFKGHPNYVQWAEKVTKLAAETRKTTTFRGRERELFGSPNDIRKQALNHPIQGGAAHVINEATIRIDAKMEELGLASKFILQVHDELIFEVPDDELKVMKTLIKTEMERPVDYRGKEIIFPVTLTVANNWWALK